MDLESSKPITAATRLGSMVLDHFMMTMLVSLIAAPAAIFQFVQDFSASHPSFPGFFNRPTDYISLFAFSLYYCKDIFNGRSPAKLVLRLQLVDDKTEQVATPAQCILRNITLIIWPIELILALINPGRRLGDRIAGTRLVYFDPSLYQPCINWFQTGLVAVVAYGVMVLFSLFIFKIMVPSLFFSPF